MQNLTIGSKIQVAITINVVLAVLIGEYLVVGALGLSGTKGVLVNLLINSVIALVYGLVVSRAITKPLREQLEVVERMTEGTGDLTRRVDTSSSAETGQLSMAFNSFLEYLQGIVQEVYETTESLASSVRYFNHSGRSIAEGAEKQTTETGQIARQIESLSFQVHAIAENTKLARDLALASEASAVAGGEVVTKTISRMDQVSLTVGQGALTTQQLKVSVDTIGAMVGTIRGISEQTNLLALNAAIEAARAGENGRGFAVVADEVRSLAVRTSEATHEINELISTMQSNLSETIDLMDAGVEQVSEGVTLSHEAGEVLKDIVTRSQQVANMVQEISVGVAGQSGVMSTITAEVETIAEIARQNSESVQLVVSFSQNLEQQTQKMSHTLRRFKFQDEVASRAS